MKKSLTARVVHATVIIAMSTPLTDTEIRDHVLAPKRVTSDGQTVENHSVRDVLDADTHLAKKNALKSVFPIRLIKLVPPGGHE